MNKSVRIFAIVDLVLIVTAFAILVGALFVQNYNLFFSAGGVLLALIIVGIILIQVKKKNAPEKEEREE